MMKKIFAAFLFILIFFQSHAVALDAQWLEGHDSNRDTILALLSDAESRFSDKLFLTADSVRTLLASSEHLAFDRQLAEDLLDVLETDRGFVAGYSIGVVSEDDYIKSLQEIISKEPPYGVEFYDYAKYKLKQISDHVSLINSSFPRYISDIKENVQKMDERDITARLYYSAFIIFIRNHIAKTDIRLPLIKEAEEDLAANPYIFTSADLSRINESIERRVVELDKIGHLPNPSANYARQIETDFLLDKAKIMKSRYEMHNGLVSKEDVWQFGDYLNDLKSQIYIESGYVREILGRDPEAVWTLSYILTDFFPKLDILTNIAIDEVRDRTDWFVMFDKVWGTGKDAVFTFLASEIWRGDGYRITLHKLIIMILYLLISVLICKWLSAIIARIFFSRLTKDAETLVRKTMFYTMLFLAVLTAFNLAEIPLTSFAFFGGALAIGIGFGTQNLFNNIISGFILVTSRPFKAGDQIKFQGQRYVVVNVGERATHLWTFDDENVFVQNKMFLEDTVINMTYLDSPKTRANVTVSAEYGSDRLKVKKCLLDIAAKHEKVAKSPEPFVLMSDFAESGIEFSLRFWVDLRHTHEENVSSEIREMIIDEFAKNNITIPYPKMDVKFL